MDRKKPNLERQQLAFYEWIVRPLFKKWEILIPQAKICLENLAKITQHWQNILDSQDESDLKMSKNSSTRLTVTDNAVPPSGAQGRPPRSPAIPQLLSFTDSKSDPKFDRENSQDQFSLDMTMAGPLPDLLPSQTTSAAIPQQNTVFLPRHKRHGSLDEKADEPFYLLTMKGNDSDEALFAVGRKRQFSQS
eukprot:TRINITY_DN786_c0_g1_i3.p1 TRINITY_DN786_c0_g1~~TRINITY_DN786_c0_g1_i3.p1  ORF type:complete len:191 (+),score=27.24 TRINITY_DN786_c0_g1_i3:259-831(+)